MIDADLFLWVAPWAVVILALLAKWLIHRKAVINTARHQTERKAGGPV